MTSSNALRRNKKYVLMNNLGNEHSLVMKFDWFIPIYKKKIFIKNFYEKCLQTSSRLFYVYKELTTASVGKWNFWNNLIILDI